LIFIQCDRPITENHLEPDRPQKGSNHYIYPVRSLPKSYIQGLDELTRIDIGIDSPQEEQ
jgi:hypothetical protein